MHTRRSGRVRSGDEGKENRKRRGKENNWKKKKVATTHKFAKLRRPGGFEAEMIKSRSGPSALRCNVRDDDVGGGKTS